MKGKGQNSVVLIGSPAIRSCCTYTPDSKFINTLFSGSVNFCNFCLELLQQFELQSIYKQSMFCTLSGPTPRGIFYNRLSKMDLLSIDNLR